MTRQTSGAIALLLLCSSVLTGCVGTASPAGDGATGVAVDVSPKDQFVEFGSVVPYAATVTGTLAPGVTWSIEPAGIGTITQGGVYTAPMSTGTFTIRATSVADTAVTGTTGVTVVQPPPPGSNYVLPPDRATTWRPGVTYAGGIPTRSTVCANIPAGASAAAVQTAVDNCPAGQVVQLAAGTYTWNGGTFVTIDKGVTVRGAGANTTLIRKTDGAVAGVDGTGGNASPLVVLGPSRYGNQSNGVAGATNLTADALKGTYAVTVASATGLAAGQLVLLDELSGAGWRTDPQGRGQVWAAPDWRVVWQLHNPGQPTDDPLALPANVSNQDAFSWFCRTDRPTGEVKKIASVSGTTVTFTTPIHISYRTARTAQLARFEFAATVGAAVEDVAFQGGDDGQVRFHWCDSCWARRIESRVWAGEGIAIDHSFRTEIRDSYVHDAAYASPGGIGYAISLSAGTADCLVENSIMVRSNKVMVARSSGAGCVIGYNYVDDGYIVYNLAWQEVHLNASHMVGPHHVLMEGNWAPNADSDKTHGNSIYNTYFRNRLTGVRSGYTGNDTSIGRAAGISAYSYWMSFVGNVLGSPGQSGSGWVYERPNFDGPAVWWVGWDDWPPNPTDASVAPTVLRDGNFDYVTNQVRWHGVGGAASTTPPAASTLPSSLYLSAKPAFFGANPWPWVTPEGTTKSYTLPAKARYDAGTPNSIP